MSTVCSLQFAAVNRDNEKDVFYVHRFVWAINFVTFYLGINVISPNNIPSIRLLIHRVIKTSLCT
jgi:hypothetical protein